MPEKDISTDLRDYIYIVPETVILDQTLDINDLRAYGIMRSYMDEQIPETELAAHISMILKTELDIVEASISKLKQKGYLHMM